MAAAGVPVVPGLRRRRPAGRHAAGGGRAHRLAGDDQALARRRRQGDARRARARATSPARWPASRREAQGAFGDDVMVLERFVERPAPRRGPGAGRRARRDVVHLLERECSIQRRHQKVVEETPSPALDAGGARGAVRGGGGGRARGRLRERGHGGVPAGPRRRLLLPGDEHAAAGRAPGDRERDSASTSCACRSRSRPAGRCPSRRTTSPAAATRWSAGSTPRTRGATTCPRRAASCTSRRPRGPASASTPGSPPAPRSPSTTTRCWPR